MLLHLHVPLRLALYFQKLSKLVGIHYIQSSISKLQKNFRSLLNCM